MRKQTRTSLNLTSLAGCCRIVEPPIDETTHLRAETHVLIVKIGNIILYWVFVNSALLYVDEDAMSRALITGLLVESAQALDIWLSGAGALWRQEPGFFCGALNHYSRAQVRITVIFLSAKGAIASSEVVLSVTDMSISAAGQINDVPTIPALR